MSSDRQRLIFGVLAFLLPAVLVGAILSPWVASSKDQLANIVIGNVLAWPMIVLQFLYGSSDGSKRKTQALETRPTGQKGDEVHVDVEKS